MSSLVRRWAMMKRRIPVTKWISNAAQSSLINAFGLVDGLRIITAVCDYIDALALLDPSKANALAVYINEDPMMACSIGVNPNLTNLKAMPIRYLVSDGNSTIDTGHTPTANVKTHILFKIPAVDAAAYGSAISYNNRTFEMYGYNGGEFNYGNQYIIVGLLIGRYIDLITDANVFKYKRDGSTEYTTTFNAFTGTFPYNIALFANRRGAMPTTGYPGVEIALYHIEDANNFKEHLVPFIGQGRTGMVDLETMTFHPNQGTGTFGETYTLSDGVTPWTPLNNQ